MKKAPAEKNPTSARSSSGHSTVGKSFTPRQRRALVALLERPRIACKELGRIAGQNNFAELVAGLRRKLGQDAILTGSTDAIDMDGQPCKPGYYELAPKARALVAELMKGAV